jgi:membrane protease subunit HflC
MKRNSLTLLIGGLLLLIFVLLLFVYQVRTTEVVLVTTFGKPTREVTEPGAYLKWPWPIQRVHRFDKRIQNFEGRFEETLTEDQYNLLIMVYVGWTIADPTRFLQLFANGSVAEAERSLENLVRSAKTAVVGRHPFAHFISTEPAKLKFSEIEAEMLKSIQSQARSNYGIDVKFLGIKKLGLPESITQKVFDRMQAERQKFAQAIQAEGEAQSIEIRTTAERDVDKILSESDAKAKEIRGQGDAAAARYYEVFKQDPDFANFLFKLNALEQILKDRSTLILDERTPPLDLLKGIGTNQLPSNSNSLPPGTQQVGSRN